MRPDPSFSTTVQEDAAAKEYHLKKAIELYPPYISSYVNLGVLMSGQGRTAEALEVGWACVLGASVVCVVSITMTAGTARLAPPLHLIIPTDVQQGAGDACEAPPVLHRRGTDLPQHCFRALPSGAAERSARCLPGPSFLSGDSRAETRLD